MACYDQVRISLLWAMAPKANNMFHVIFKINYRDQKGGEERFWVYTEV